MQTESTIIEPVEEIWASAELLDATRRGEEIWRPISESDGWLEVSNLGRVRSWIIPGRSRRRRDEPKILVCNLVSDGYPRIQMYINGKRKCKLVHVAMCEEFIGPRHGKMEGGHKNDNKTDNTLLNVRWCTKAMNESERVANGGTKSFQREEVDVDGVLHLRCTQCASLKPTTDFYKLGPKNRSRLKRQSACKSCANVKRTAHRRSAVC